MWERIADLQDDIDVVVNLAYDWLPLYLTSWFDVPVVHFISMAIAQRRDGRRGHTACAWRHPDRLGAHTRAQAATFDRVVDGASTLWTVPFRILGSGVITDRYDVCRTCRLRSRVPRRRGSDLSREGLRGRRRAVRAQRLARQGLGHHAGSRLLAADSATTSRTRDSSTADS